MPEQAERPMRDQRRASVELGVGEALVVAREVDADRLDEVLELEREVAEVDAEPNCCGRFAKPATTPMNGQDHQRDVIRGPDSCGWSWPRYSP